MMGHGLRYCLGHQNIMKARSSKVARLPDDFRLRVRGKLH